MCLLTCLEWTLIGPLRMSPPRTQRVPLDTNGNGAPDGPDGGNIQISAFGVDGDLPLANHQ